MFASVGTVLKLHSWSDNQLEQISTFNPKKTQVPATKILSVSWCHDNSYIAILPENSLPQIVSSKDRTNISLVHTISALKDVSAITFKNHTKRNIALGNKCGEVILYDTKNRNIACKVTSLSDTVRHLEFNCRDDQLAVLCDNNLNIFCDHDGVFNFAKEIGNSDPSVSTITKFHPSIASLVAVGGDNGSVALWDVDKEEKLFQYQKHSSPVTGIAFTANQNVMVTTGLDNKICVLDNSSADCLFRMSIHQPVTSVDVSPDDQYIAVGLEDGCICIYDVRDPLRRLICSKSHNFAVSKIAFERGPVVIESLHDGHSFTTLNDSEIVENAKSEPLNVEQELTESFEERLKKDVIKMIKNHMGSLENQLAEHCAKFQSFISNEFDSIHNAMARWDVFSAQDASDIGNTIESADTKSAKSSSTRKSVNHQLSV